jgi:hypothetical protein
MREQFAKTVIDAHMHFPQFALGLVGGGAVSFLQALEYPILAGDPESGMKR